MFNEKPSNLLARAQTFSSYKHHNTIKILVGITPQETISFVSEAWGGCVSDKYLTENCGFLEKLTPGDMVMADKVFTITESVELKHAKLVIPAFMRGKVSAGPKGCGVDKRYSKCQNPRRTYNWTTQTKVYRFGGNLIN